MVVGNTPSPLLSRISPETRECIVDLRRVDEGLSPIELRRRGDQGTPERANEGERHGMVWHADADGLALRQDQLPKRTSLVAWRMKQYGPGK